MLRRPHVGLGDCFPVGLRSLEKRLQDEGLTEGSDNRSTVVIKVIGRSQRVIKLRRTALGSLPTVCDRVTAVTPVTGDKRKRKKP